MSSKLSFKLISCYNNIVLPTPLNDIKSIKISKFYYKIISPQQYAIKISIPSFERNNFFNGVQCMPYTLILFNDGNANNYIMYENVYSIPDYYDKYPRGIVNVGVNITDDKDIPITDISSDNPVYLEIEFY